MNPFARHIRAEAFNNAWANHRLPRACARLGQGTRGCRQRASRRPVSTGFFCIWDAPQRIEDFRAPGFDEAAIGPAGFEGQSRA